MDRFGWSQHIRRLAVNIDPSSRHLPESIGSGIRIRKRASVLSIVDSAESELRLGRIVVCEIEAKELYGKRLSMIFRRELSLRYLLGRPWLIRVW